MSPESFQSLGGKARAELLSPDERSRIASHAATSRWSRTNEDWCVFSTPSPSQMVLLCERCGGTHQLKLPMPVKACAKTVNAFCALHANCQPPEAHAKSQEKPDQQKKPRKKTSRGPSDASL
jgi:hypothetical protein